MAVISTPPGRGNEGIGRSPDVLFASPGRDTSGGGSGIERKEALGLVQMTLFIETSVAAIESADWKMECGHE